MNYCDTNMNAPSNTSNQETEAEIGKDKLLQYSGLGDDTSEIPDVDCIPQAPDVEDIPQAPDGGWGWVVCFAAFISMIILDGMMFSFGVLYLELLDYFEESKGYTAMVGSALMGIHLIAGPVTSALVNAWGVRVVTMAGAVMATVAFCFSVLSPSITVLIVLYGVIGGIGVSMIYLPSIIIVGFYFEKRRALANGITQSGSGIGTFIYSPISDYLLREFGWKGTMLILAGLVLNCLACGALYRPIQRTSRKSENRQKNNEVNDETSLVNGDVSLNKDLTTRSNVSIDRGNPGKTVAHMLLNRENKNKYTLVNGAAFNALTSRSVPNSPGTRRHCSDSKTLHRSAIGNSLHGDVNKLSSNQASRKSLTHSEVTLSGSRDSINRTSLAMKPLYKKDAFYSGSLLRIPEYNLKRSASLYSVPHSAVGKCDNDEDDDASGYIRCLRRVKDVGPMLKHMVGVRLLVNPTFLLSMISMVLWTTHSTVLTLLPDCAVMRGVTREHSAYLLSIIGGANTAARIAAGWMSDRPEVDCLYVNIAALVIGGAICIVMAFTSVFSLLALESFVFGLCMGTWTSLRPIILVELLGLDNLTNAFGLVAMFQGVAFLVGPPIAGTLFDKTQSYVIPFVVAGAAFVTSGLVCCVLCRISSKSRLRGLQSPDGASLQMSVDVKCEVEDDI